VASDLKILAETRVADAMALLQAGRWAAAYYLLGYAIECGLVLPPFPHFCMGTR